MTETLVDAAHSDVTTLGGIVVIAVIVAGIARNRGIAPAIPLLIAGVIVGFAPFGPQSPTDPEFVLVAILAPLVFGEALSSSIVDLRKVSKPVMILAIGLVLFGAFVVGMTVTVFVPGIPVFVAFSLGAILAPTDAVAVSATAKAAGLPRRLVHILEGESLVNDGTALTLLRVFSTAAAAGALVTLGPWGIGLILVQSVVGGLAAGVGGGLLLVFIIRRSSDTVVVNGMVLIAPFPIYFGAEAIEGSGILAVVAGALIAAQGTSSDVTYSGRLQATSIWRTVTFILQATAFFLVGIELKPVLNALERDDWRQLAILVPVVFVALVVSRFAFMYLMNVISKGGVASGRGWIVAAWAGTRGPISALAAFTLPFTMEDGVTPFPYRDLIISVTFCCVVITLLLAPTVAPLARKLKLPKDNDTETLARVRVQMAKAAIDRLLEIQNVAEREERPLPEGLAKSLRTRANQRLDSAKRTSAPSEATSAERSADLAKRIQLEMAHAESQELLRMRDEEGLADALMRDVQKHLDVRIAALRSPH